MIAGRPQVISMDDRLVYFSAVPGEPWRDHSLRRATTPNGQRITRLQVQKEHRLLVHTKSRIYHLRRGKLRLWKLL